MNLLFVSNRVATQRSVEVRFQVFKRRRTDNIDDWAVDDLIDRAPDPIRIGFVGPDIGENLGYTA